MLNAIFTAVLEVVAKILFDVVFATLVRGPGYVIVRLVTRSKKVDPDAMSAFVAGVLFWAVLAGGGYLLYRNWFG